MAAWGPIAAAMGFGLFGILLLQMPYRKQRFFSGAFWFFLIQLIQLWWFVSHPYLYIYPLYFFLSLAWGVQFGFFSLFVTPASIQSKRKIFAMAGLWTLLEWSRLFVLTGFSWNPVGLALAAHLYSLQAASLVGVYGLSFWVIYVNFFFLRAFVKRKEVNARSLFSNPWVAWVLIAILPYGYGAFQVYTHQGAIQKSIANGDVFRALLVQTAFPAEEAMVFPTREAAVRFVQEEWEKILSLLQPYLTSAPDLIALPEYVVPYSTYFPVFSYENVKHSFETQLHNDALPFLPSFQEHLALKIKKEGEETWMVNNAFWVQSIANAFDSDVILGLEDRDYTSVQDFSSYSAAFLFRPDGWIQRYEKRVLVPMGEYIPFSFFRSIAATYGITGSFTPGKAAKVFSCRSLHVGTSICYEETYGHLMRENRLLGAELLVNLTNDGWYPHSLLPKQHFEHARLRTVEMGIPLVRACNTGITGAIDALGRTLAILGEGTNEDLAAALLVEVPKYSYLTPYTFYGDWLIVGVSVFALAFFFRFDQFH